MKICLLRHGEAEPHAAGDELRRLTVRGEEEVRRSAQRLARESLTAIYASPYVRAQQTAAIVKNILGFVPPIVTVPGVTPDDDPAAALDWLAALPTSGVLLATHNPFVSQLAGLLIHGHRQEPLPMGTGSLAILEGPMAVAGAMTLIELFHP
ncbi:phosphohistidine phosphatase SixA [Pseudomonas duriflava]|uniref:Phosphohistidine phosphatase SixA n=1 Tax=Pseudomonas duriflava TaxID=459528 RepID=A0A562Q9W6_9PSED|nr:phosphohistidine phosphatase SixA [Pseudomonas duriflava]TWI53528.1 phosphohistidine phosphatase SixA [Pseudomonas duriflava]